MNSNLLKPSIAYLIGLLCARGHIYLSAKRVIIEFAHKNKTIEGIAHCPKCGEMATSPAGQDYLQCKNPKCRSVVDKSVKPVYEQQVSTYKSIEEVIIPFLAEELKCGFSYMGN
ncbi:MAG: hypothetical protein J5601_02700, partial [Elusimicrobiaceae bacterium]|nr:hypothetical protein [Elusimicrobiaceae bacterium]